jgi:lysophospholipase L1-like esterase
MGTMLLILLALYGALAGTPDVTRTPKAGGVPQATAPESEGNAQAPPRDASSPGRLLVVGDSLAEGTEAPLARLLPGWRIQTSAYTGRHADDGVAEIVSRGNLPGVIVVSLGTNDDPSATSTFAGEVQRVLDAAGQSRCVIWANIVRPPYAGVSYSGYNRVLDRLSLSQPNLTVVDWAGIVRSQPGLLASDGVHATSQGYAVRAQAIAAAVSSCGSVQAYGQSTGAGVPGD